MATASVAPEPRGRRPLSERARLEAAELIDRAGQELATEMPDPRRVKALMDEAWGVLVLDPLHNP